MCMGPDQHRLNTLSRRAKTQRPRISHLQRAPRQTAPHCHGAASHSFVLKFVPKTASVGPCRDYSSPVGIARTPPEVLLDDEVIIEHDVATACDTFDSLPTVADSPGRLRYLGTARGPAGYISDVQRLGIADGVVVLTRNPDHVARLVLHQMAPGLGTRGYQATEGDTSPANSCPISRRMTFAASTAA